MTDTLPESTDDVNDIVEAEWTEKTIPFIGFGQ
jgi:hypothetical protein